MAETALKDGRLDEAHGLVTDEDLADHRRAQKVRLQLTPAFLDRAARRLEAGQFAEALSDLDKAGAAGTQLDEIARRREEALTAMRRGQRAKDQRRQTLEAAADRIAAGSVDGAHQLLERIDDDSHADSLRDQADRRRRSLRRRVEEIGQRLEGGRLEAAADALREAVKSFSQASELRDLETQLVDRVLARVRASIESGAVQRADDELGMLGEMGRSLPARQEVQRMLDLAATAACELADRRVADALATMRKLAHVLPGCAWVTGAVTQLTDAQTNLDAVLAGPIGNAKANVTRWGIDTPTRPHPGPRVRTDAIDTAATVAAGELPSRLLVAVDNGGSYLLLRSPRVTIGRAGPRNSVDVPLFADLPNGRIEIARVEDDYVLFASSPVDVSGRKVTQKLLADGDRIRIGRRGRMTFRQPSRMSSSAALDLGEGLRTHQDVRRVVLFDRHALVGSHGHCHITARGGELTLFERSGRLWLQEVLTGAGPVRSRDRARPVTMGEYIGESGVGLSVRPWQSDPKSSVI
jgi:tetratricopeptide (TPR) repeat protein